MTDISDRLQVEGPDRDGDYELTLRDCDCDDGQHSHYINRAQATMLITALSPLPALSAEAPAPRTERTLPERLAEMHGYLNGYDPMTEADQHHAYMVGFSDAIRSRPVQGEGA